MDYNYAFFVQYIVPPVVGAIIGLFTNYMAIKMLFRPYKPIKFMGLRLSFTPGVIPKQHTKLAEKIGEAVDEHLLTGEDINNLFQSDSIQSKIGGALDGMYSQFGMLSAFITPEIKELISSKVLGLIHDELPDILDELDVKTIVTQKVQNFPLEKLEKIILDVAKSQLRYVTLFGGILGFVMGCVNIIL